MKLSQVKVPRDLMRYIVPKGFIAVDGTSLTVCEVDNEESWFTFMLVAYTQASRTSCFFIFSLSLEVAVLPLQVLLARWPQSCPVRATRVMDRDASTRAFAGAMSTIDKEQLMHSSSKELELHTITRVHRHVCNDGVMSKYPTNNPQFP